MIFAFDIGPDRRRCALGFGALREMQCPLDGVRCSGHADSATGEVTQPVGYDRPEHVAAAARDVPTNPKMCRRVIGQDPLDVPEKRLQALFGRRAIPGYLKGRRQPVGVEVLRDRLSACAEPGLHHRNPRFAYERRGPAGCAWPGRGRRT